MKPGFYERYGFWILLVSLFLGPLVSGGALRAVRTNRNAVKEWLPATYRETTEFNWFLEHFAGGQFVLMSWEGCTLDDQRLRLLTDKLLPARAPEAGPHRPRLFSRVITGREILDDLMAAPTKLPRKEALERLSGALIGPDGQQTCAVVMFTPEGERNPRQTLEVIWSIAVDECAIARDAIRMGGPPVDNVALDVAGERSLMRLAAVTGVVGLAISWWCLRSVHLTAMVFSAGMYSAAASFAVVWYSGGTMNSILLTMFALVYVATMSGAIHLANYYRDTALEHGVRGASGRALRLAWLPLSLATGTTAVGLASLAISELVPIQMFGIYSAVGVVISLLVLFLGLPSMLELFPPKLAVQPISTSARPALADMIFSDRWNVVGRAILRRHAWVTAVCLAVMVVCGYGMTKIQTSVKLMNFFSSDSEIVQHYTWLEKNLGPLVPMEVVLRFDKSKCDLDLVGRIDLLRKTQERIQSLPEVGSAMSAATFTPLPPAASRGSAGIGRAVERLLVRDRARVTRSVYNKRLETHRGEYIENDYLSETENEEFWRVSARVGALNDIDYGLFVAQIRGQVEPLLAKARAAGVEGVSAVYTGLVPLVYKSQRTLLDGLVIGFIMDMVMIILVMMIAVRDFGAGLLLMIPSVFPAAIVFGLMGWMGIIVDVGTVMPPAVALGVTVDDVVHFLLWYRRGILQGMSREDAVMLAYKDCARPMYQSWGVIGLGLSAFAFSPFTPTQRFGYLMVTLLTAALVGNLLLLPALLAGPMGALFGYRIQRRNRRAHAAAPKASMGAASPTEHHAPLPHLTAAEARHTQPA